MLLLLTFYFQRQSILSGVGAFRLTPQEALCFLFASHWLQVFTASSTALRRAAQRPETGAKTRALSEDAETRTPLLWLRTLNSTERGNKITVVFLLCSGSIKLHCFVLVRKWKDTTWIWRWLPASTREIPWETDSRRSFQASGSWTLVYYVAGQLDTQKPDLGGLRLSCWHFNFLNVLCSGDRVDG